MLGFCDLSSLTLLSVRWDMLGRYWAGILSSNSISINVTKFLKFPDVEAGLKADTWEVL
jgi:hypothetical protein